MQKQISSGIYLLELYLDSEIRIPHRKFSHLPYKSGFYYYIGSAQTNLNKRIQRHIRKNKKMHWHIDYLTSRTELNCNKIYILEKQSKQIECKLIKTLSESFEISFPAIGFGSSDCSRCVSHLLYSKLKIDQSQLLSLYQFTVLSIPSLREICWE